MKKGVIIFHSNIRNIYDYRWVSKSVDTMINQSDNDFIFYEINYGDDDGESVIPEDCKIEKKFWSIKLSNYAEAMNFILDKAFEDGCDYVFNTNLDDYYDTSRISSQLEMMINGDYDILSCDFCYIKEKIKNGINTDVIEKFINIHRYGSIKENLRISHNVIAHPAVCYNKRFWIDSNNRYDIKKVPEEDMDLWIRSIKRGYKFGIHKKTLLYYRIHDNQVSVKK
jgi:hypothetical protein